MAEIWLFQDILRFRRSSLCGCDGGPPAVADTALQLPCNTEPQSLHHNTTCPAYLLLPRPYSISEFFSCIPNEIFLMLPTQPLLCLHLFLLPFSSVGGQCDVSTWRTPARWPLHRPQPIHESGIPNRSLAILSIVCAEGQISSSVIQSIEVVIVLIPRLIIRGCFYVLI